MNSHDIWYGWHVFINLKDYNYSYVAKRGKQIITSSIDEKSNTSFKALSRAKKAIKELKTPSSLILSDIDVSKA